jgi:KDO2-lipid IV(A) lauroyltransferase
LYFILKISEFIIQNIPRKAGYFVFTVFGYLSYYLNRKRRHTLRYNLCAVLGPENVDSKLLKKVFVNYAKYYCDLFSKREKVMSYINKEGADDFKNTSCANINRYLGQKHGCIIVSMHYGNWDVAGGFGAGFFPGRFHVVVEKLSPGMFRWFKETRERFGMKVIPSTDIKSMLRVLKAGDALVLLGDRDLDRLGYKMEYFGKKAYIPSGPAKLSLMSHCPILMGASPRDEHDNFRPFVEEAPINDEDMPRSDEAAENITRQIVDRMEGYVRKDPSQWCMLQQIFVDEPPMEKI